MIKFRETIILKVGGSLLIPEMIDVVFIKQLKELVTHCIQDGYRMVLVIGGGKTSRYYQNAAAEFSHVTSTDLDWIGIKTIRLNAEFIHQVFSDLDIHPEVVFTPLDLAHTHAPIVIVGAWEPGRSSDADAVEMALSIKAHQVINFSNVSHVYSSDPHNNPSAQKFETLSWEEYRSLIPHEWKPGLSAPFDPIASEKAQEHHLTVVILGASLENLKSYLAGEKFEGTLIR